MKQNHTIYCCSHCCLHIQGDDLFHHNLHHHWSLRLLAVIDGSSGLDGVLTHGRDMSDNGEMVEVSRQSPHQGVDWI